MTFTLSKKVFALSFGPPDVAAACIFLPLGLQFPDSLRY
jgi:hypothetical protein